MRDPGGANSGGVRRLGNHVVGRRRIGVTPAAELVFVDTLDEQQKAVRITRLRNRLPTEIRRKLADRLKRDDLTVLVRILYVEWEEDEKTKKKRKIVRPQETVRGAFSGLQALSDSPILKIGRRLSEASAALANARAAIDQPNASMQKWAHALEYVRKAERELKEQEALVETFCRPENLQLLWLLTDYRVDQIALVHAALELATSKPVTEAEATVGRDAWAQQIRDEHGGKDFEIVG